MPKKQNEDIYSIKYANYNKQIVIYCVVAVLQDLCFGTQGTAPWRGTAPLKKFESSEGERATIYELFYEQYTFFIL